ncbi:MAG: fasciclin domain-containing protein [Verrucomicrobiota bacterium]
MKKILLVLSLSGAFLFGTTTQLLAGGCGGCSSASGGYAKKSDIVQTASKAGNFKTLTAAIDAAGLTETLQSNGPFTVFAPTDEAFAALPEGTLESLLKPENKDQLVAILTYHVVPGKVMAKDVQPGDVATVNGAPATVGYKDGKLMIDNAEIVATDIVTSNGVIHVIDAVILPSVKTAALIK